MELLKMAGVAAVTTLLVLAIVNRVDVPGLNPRMVPPPESRATTNTSTSGAAAGASS